MTLHRYKLQQIEPRVRITSLCSVFDGIRPPGYFFQGESHDFWEAVFVLNGRAGITSGETVYTLCEGQMIFHPPCEFHRLWNDGDGPLRLAIISFETDAFPIEHRAICSFSSFEAVLRTVNRLRQAFETDGIFVVGSGNNVKKGDEQRAVAALEDLFLEIFDRQSDDGATVSKDKFSATYSKAVSVMKEDMSVRLSAEEIAEACGVSLSTLQKLFFRYSGMGMMKYYEGLRMQYARNLLDSGSFVKEAAFATGYKDQNYFSSAYKRHYGVSPTQRKKIEMPKKKSARATE